MSFVRRSVACVFFILLAPHDLVAQADQVAAGIRAESAHDFATARHEFEAALHQDPNDYAANWHLSLTLIDIAKQTPDHIKSASRDSTYRLAESYARRAVAVRPDDAEGHFVLANAIGRALLSMSARERVRRALEVRAEALRAVALNPRHDGAWHILGRWNAEVMRLPGIEKFLAKAFFGASIFNSASWDEAERDLRLAVQYAPTVIVHHFDLAEILVSREKWADAKAQLDDVAALPVVDVSDPSYKEQARALEPKVIQKLRK